MGFQFPLASVLRHRGMIEDREERMLQNIQQEIARTMQLIEDFDAEIAKANVARRANVRKASTALDMHAAYGYLENLKQQKTEQIERLAKLEDLRTKQIVIYRAARRDREVLDDIFDRSRTAYESEAAKREQRTVEDTFAARRARG